MENPQPIGNKNVLENPFLGGIMVPIAIVLVGALIIFGVTRMLSSQRDYHDLVRELDSKTFGNRWVAAFELSKLISTAQIPQGDVPVLVADLARIYSSSADARTRNFLIVALGALKSEAAVATLEKGLADSNKDVVFHAVVALGNTPLGYKVNWDKLLPFLKSADPGLVQAVIFTLAHHRVEKARENLIGLLGHSSLAVKYSAATGLIYYKENQALPILEEILQLTAAIDAEKVLFRAGQIRALKSNVLAALVKIKWPVLNEIIKTLAHSNSDIKIVAQARDALNQLKN